MGDSFPILENGTRVRTFTGYTGSIYKPAKRAAADIRIASVESERDMRPYTVLMDRGGFSTYRGHELDVIAPGVSGYAAA